MKVSTPAPDGRCQPGVGTAVLGSPGLVFVLSWRSSLCVLVSAPDQRRRLQIFLPLGWLSVSLMVLKTLSRVV